jgi:cbb3-type cytochrome oxidase cytochrome c subunit/cytochrome c553
MKMTPRLIIIGGLAVVLTVVSFVVFLPYVVFRPAPTVNTNPYTALEQEGRDLYVSNGCVYCHSQFTRPLDVTPSRASEAGEYAYNKPHQLGTLRTGPDLANIGLKRGDRWEANHLKDPRQLTPNSIMPSFSFLNDHQLKAIVAYLNTLGNKQTASTDLMIPVKYLSKKQPYAVTIGNWNRGRQIYAERCLTCHGCAGKGDGPYAMINNARPADLRQPRFNNLPSSFLFWRVSEGVPGTVMPMWKQSLSDEERWLVELFVQHAFMDMAPHLANEGDLPARFDKADPIERSVKTLDEGKAIFVANCAFCHGYAGNGDGPDAAGLMPKPPSFAETSTYVAWKPGDWFWRVSESLPLRAMPQWHTWFDPRQLWLVANYARDVLTFPEPGAKPVDPMIPAKAKSLKMPHATDIMRGRVVYLQRCWMCHGDAGQGEGPDGQHLSPPPANFTDPDVKTIPDYEFFWKVSYGLGNAAMPQWHLLLSEEDRWAAIKYLKQTFVNPSEPTEVDDNPPVEYQALDPAPFAPTADAIERGKSTYETLCAECHGPKAKGDGPYGAQLKPPPANLTEDPALTADEGWWYWRVDLGVVGDKNTHPTAMPAWRLILTEQQKWEVVWYARNLAGSDKAGAKPGGGQ